MYFCRQSRRKTPIKSIILYMVYLKYVCVCLSLIALLSCESPEREEKADTTHIDKTVEKRPVHYFSDRSSQEGYAHKIYINGIENADSIELVNAVYNYLETNTIDTPVEHLIIMNDTSTSHWHPPRTIWDIDPKKYYLSISFYKGNIRYLYWNQKKRRYWFDHQGKLERHEQH